MNMEAGIYMKKLNVAVVFGGVSNEHEISLKSAYYILNNLARGLFEVIPIGITKAGQWFFYSGSIEKIPTGEWENDKQNCKAVVFSPNPETKGFLRLEPESKCFLMKVDCVFLVLHGRNGEDGRLQGFFEAAKMPFVGPGSLSSALCMDKELTHRILESCGIKMAKYMAIRKVDLKFLSNFCKNVEQKLQFPVFVKPANCGSSVGVSKCEQPDELERAILKAFDHDDKAICEQAVLNCHEVECAVLGNENPVAAEVLGEIEASGKFYDYDSKYKVESKLTIPANLSEKTTREVKEIAIKAFKAIGCRGLSRVDFLVNDSDGIILNEINTLPGFTEISMFPKLWADSGLKGPKLIEKLVELAMEQSGFTEIL